MKKYIVVIFIAIAAVMMYVVFKLQSFDLLPVERKFLSELKSSTETTYQIFFIGGNATTQDAIQITETKNKSAKVVMSIEGYNNVTLSKLLNDSIIQLVLSDTSYSANEPDTVFINVFTGQIDKGK